MNFTIVIVGLLVSVSGVILAWNQKGTGTWATFSFGFLLVLVGGPVSSRLGTISLSGTGVEVEFNAVAVSQTEQETLSSQAATAFLAFSPSTDNENSPERILLGNASKAFQKELSTYLTSLGFLPIQPTGKELIGPGTVLRIEEGRPVVWASPSEAFSNLQVSHSSVAIPRLAYKSATENKYVEVLFDCTNGSMISEASLLALSTSIRPEVGNSIADATDLRVVQSTLSCIGFRLAATAAAETKKDEDIIDYGENARVVLGIKLASLAAEVTGD